MKKTLPYAVLLLLVVLASGSALFLFADPAVHSATTPNSSPWAPVTATRDQLTVPGMTMSVPAPSGNEGFIGLASNLDRAPEAFPPMHFAPHSGSLKPRPITPKDFYLNAVEGAITSRMIVKFTEESMIRWDGKWPYSKSGANVKPLLGLLAAHPEITMQREINEQTEETLDSWERTGEQNIGEDLANLNNFYVLDISSNPDPMALIREVINLDIVETAFYQPKGEPACTDIAPTTPSWVANQTYHGAAPTGVNSDYAGTYYGTWGHGNPSAWTVDIEWDWTENHEDFPSGFAILDGPDGGGTADHGDACSGIIGACDNSYGMSGESPNVTPKGESVAARSWAQAIANAQSHLFSGESMFIEIHAYAVNPGYSCDNTCGNCGQFGYVAIEYWDDNYNAIHTATAAGRLVYEAAGNGQMNLDNAVYGSHFDRNYRDSGAILVGASHSTSQVAMCWSNYGTRVDCNGWGENVYTLGYGDLFNPNGNRNQMYTATFSGTSSATPIVTASGNDLQGVMQGKYGVTASPTDMRSYLHDNGTPYSGAHPIGNKPDLVNAINWIEPDVMPWTSAGWSGPLVPRNNNGATSTNCTYTPLDGNSNNTYMNAASYNWAFTPAPDSGSGGVYAQYFLDGDYVWWAVWGPRIAPYQQWQYNNFGPFTVRGGRHTWESSLDPNNDFAEYNENNNTAFQQMVWSPLQMTAQSYVVRSAPPLKTWGNPTYVNGDGIRSVPSGSTYWLGCVVLPQSGNDVDLYSYADSYNDSVGFDNIQKVSSAGAGAPDMILVNGNWISPMNRLFQAVRYSDASTADYAVEVDQASVASWYPPYSTNKSMDANGIMDLYELYLTSGTSYFIGAINITGGLDLEVAVYGDTSAYYALSDARWFANNSGANGTEYLNVTPTHTGWYVAAVLKSSSASYGVSGTYTFDFESPPVTNLTPGAGRSGWDAPVVVRNAADATPSSTVFPAAVQGNTTNYLNSMWYNAGTAPTGTSFWNYVSVDNVLLGSSQNSGTLNPFSYSQSNNVSVGPIRGGRHTLSYKVDTLSQVTESNEADNNWSGQYVWSPMLLTRDAAQMRIFPPARGGGTYPNCDGFQMPGVSGYALGAALLPKASASDFDLYMYSDYSGTLSGFTTMIGASAYGANTPDYVLIPWRIAGSQTAWYPAVVNFNNGTDSVAVEYDNAIGRNFSSYPWQVSNPDTIPAHGIFNVYEVFMQAGTQYRFLCHILSGSSDVELRLHYDSTAVQSRVSYLAFANAAGPGLDETLNYTPTMSDWYTLVVDKITSSDIALTSIYNLSGSIIAPPAPPLLVQTLVIQPWTSSTSVQLAWTHVTQDSLGHALTGRRYVVYRNSSIGIVPLPADSIGGTTDSTFIDNNASGLLNFYRVKVKAN